MHDVDAFEDDVSAYPAIVGPPERGAAPSAWSRTPAASLGEPMPGDLARWVIAVAGRRAPRRRIEASRLDGWFDGGDLWPSGTPASSLLIADLEARFPPLQDPATGTRVGIGVATGCDDVFITETRTWSSRSGSCRSCRPPTSPTVGRTGRVASW